MAGFKSAFSKGIGTASVSAFTAASVTTLIGASLANVASVEIKASITITRGSTVVYIIKDVRIPVGSTFVPVGGDQKIVLQQGDIVKVTSDTATSVDAIFSYLES